MKPSPRRIHWMATCATIGSILLSIALAKADDTIYIGTPGSAFDVPTNWADGVLPDAADTALIGTRSTVYDGTNQSSMVIGHLTASSGSFAQTGGDLTVALISGDDNFGTSGGTSSFSLEQNAHFSVNDSGGGFIFRIGSNSAATAFNMSGDAVLTSSIATGYFVFGDNTILTGTMTDNAHIDVQSGYQLLFGDNQNGVANITMSGYSKITSAASNFRIGNGGSGNLTLNEHASIEITANAMTLGSGSSDFGSGSVILNDNASITGTKITLLDTGNETNIANGYLEMNGSSTVNVSNVTIGHLAAAGSTATVTVNTGAVLTATDHITLGRDDTTAGSAEATLNINGGTVETCWIESGGDSGGSGVHTVNIDHGTIRALATGSNFFRITNGTNPIAVNIKAGGLTFDTNTFDVAIGVTLTGEGGLTKVGKGKLSLDVASSYLGDTVLEDGTLSLSSISLSDTGNLYLTTGSILDLVFDGTDEIAALYIDGVLQPEGTYDSANLSEFITGTGSLLVTVPEPSTVGELFVAGFGFLVLMRGRRVT